MMLSLNNLQNVTYNPVTDSYEITFYLWQDVEQIQLDSNYLFLGGETIKFSERVWKVPTV